MAKYRILKDGNGMYIPQVYSKNAPYSDQEGWLTLQEYTHLGYPRRCLCKTLKEAKAYIKEDKEKDIKQIRAKQTTVVWEE
jgi:hypothetical protein